MKEHSKATEKFQQENAAAPVRLSEARLNRSGHEVGVDNVEMFNERECYKTFYKQDKHKPGQELVGDG